MRLSDLAGKEVINLGDGARLGVIDECELIFDSKTGLINALTLPAKSGMFNIFNERKVSNIHWNSIKRIGEEIIIVDLNNNFSRIDEYRQRKNTY